MTEPMLVFWGCTFLEQEALEINTAISEQVHNPLTEKEKLMIVKNNVIYQRLLSWSHIFISLLSAYKIFYLFPQGRYPKISSHFVLSLEVQDLTIIFTSDSDLAPLGLETCELKI